MGNILILDIGNSNTKCYVFEIRDRDISTAELRHEEHQKTNRGHPWDLVDTCKNMFTRAIEAAAPDYAIITSFGDAFVYYDPKRNNRPRFVFADEPVETLIDSDYSITGFPTGKIALTGIKSLRAKHQAKWNQIVPINIFMGRELGDNANWWSWDTTQASISSEFDLSKRDWIYKSEGLTDKYNCPTGMAVDQVYCPTAEPKPRLCHPTDEIGMFKKVPILAGGLDNGFADATEQTPFIVAGTWLVVSTPCKEFKPTPEQQEFGVRWLITGNGHYHAQTVKRSKPDQNLPKTIIGHFQRTGIGCVAHQKVRVFGSYAGKLCQRMNRWSQENERGLTFVVSGREVSETAIYAYESRKNKRRIPIQMA